MSEARVGAIVIAVVILLSVVGYELKQIANMAGYYEVTARVAKADGLAKDTEVRFTGVKVGSVTLLDLDPKTYQAIVHLNILDDVKIPIDSAFNIVTPLIGTTYACIAPGNAQTMLPRGGMLVKGVSSGDVMNMVGKALDNDSSQQSC